MRGERRSVRQPSVLVLALPVSVMDWNEAIHRYLTDHLGAAGSPASTRTTRRQHLQLAAKHLGEDPFGVTSADLLAWFGTLDVAPETRRSRRTTLRSFYGWAAAEGHVEANVALALPKVKATAPKPRPLPVVRYQTALAAADERERLMLRLGWECGLRRAEIATGHSDRIVEDLVGYSLRVLGKGGRERVVPLPADLAGDLLRLPAGWFFPGRDGGHLSPRWVGRLLADVIPGKVWTAHTLRHSAATRWYGVERDTFAVQELLGHANPATTRAYVAIPNESLRRTVEAAA